jgi:anaerobic ribonucleoside-triphosphate reductase
MIFYTTINNIRICSNCGDIAFVGELCPVCGSNHSEPLHHFIKSMGYIAQAKEEKNRTKPLITPHSWLRYDPFSHRITPDDLSL